MSALLYYAATLGFFIFIIYIFATAPHFGPRAEECNTRVKYAVFGVDSAATDPVFQGLFLASFALLFIQKMVRGFGKYLAWLGQRQRDDLSLSSQDSTLDTLLERLAMAGRLRKSMLPALQGMRVIADAAARGVHHCHDGADDLSECW